MFPEGRLFDFLIVGVVALIVVGPKDLPLLMRKVGQFMAKVRGMAAEFRASFDELARQSELDELRREVQALRTSRPMDFAATHLGAGDVMSEIRSDLADTRADIDATKAAITAHPAPDAVPVAPDSEPSPPVAEPSPQSAEPAEPARKASAT
jgi:sec-independent protein translocase protein TatB